MAGIYAGPSFLSVPYICYLSTNADLHNKYSKIYNASSHKKSPDSSIIFYAICYVAHDANMELCKPDVKKILCAINMFCVIGDLVIFH